MFRTERLRRTAAVCCLAALGVACAALPASAHVTVSADDSSRGADDSILTFRVPNEMDNAASVGLQVQFPTATPLAEVDPSPMAGYTITTKKVTFKPPLVTDDGTITSGVGEVTWTATNAAAGIPAGDFDSFRVLVGPLPTKGDQLVFPVIQTYSNGQTVSWIQPTTDPANPPEHPAAILPLTGNAAPASSAAPTVSSGPAAELSGYATTSQADTGRTLGVIGIVLGLLGLLAGAAGLARGRARS